MHYSLTHRQRCRQPHCHAPRRIVCINRTNVRVGWLRFCFAHHLLVLFTTGKRPAAVVAGLSVKHDTQRCARRKESCVDTHTQRVSQSPVSCVGRATYVDDNRRRVRRSAKDDSNIVDDVGMRAHAYETRSNRIKSLNLLAGTLIRLEHTHLQITKTIN